MHTWIDIATLTKKRNAQGRFVVRCQANLLLCLKPGMQVAFVPPVLDAPRNARISEMTKTGETTGDVTFEYLDGPWESAQEDALIGCHCLVLRSELDRAEIQDEVEDLIGFEVYDKQAGFIGVVQDEVHNLAQSLLVIERESDYEDDGTEVLVPHVPAIVNEVDADAKTIQVDLPVGLLDL